MELEREPEKEKKSTPARAPEGEIAAFLGEGTEFQGTLTFEGTIRIDGKLSGEVVSQHTLIVGEDAEVDAEINVGILVCRGQLRGNVKASDRIELHETAELRGNISTGRLLISEGAVFHGSCEMPQAADKVTPITQPMQAVRARIEGGEEGEEAGSGP